MGGGEIERRAIAGREQFVLADRAPVPHRPDRMDNVLRRQPKAARDLGPTGLTAAEPLTCGQQLRPSGAMNRAVDPAATAQAGIRGVNDGIDGERGDVGNADLEPDGAYFGG